MKRQLKRLRWQEPIVLPAFSIFWLLSACRRRLRDRKPRQCALGNNSGTTLNKSSSTDYSSRTIVCNVATSQNIVLHLTSIRKHRKILRKKP